MKSLRPVLSSASFGLLITCIIGCGGSGAAGDSQQPAALTTASVTPASIAAGSSATTLTVSGTGFTTSTVIQVGGTAEATTFISSTEVTAVVPASQLASGTTLSIVATNGSVASTGPAVDVVVNNLSPTLAQVTPSSVLAGAGSATLTFTGANFVPATTVQVNGGGRATTFQSTTQISATLTSADLAAGGTLAVTVVNPSPGGGTSSASLITVNNPVPTVTSLSPTSVVAGANAPTTVTINGTNFVPLSVVSLGGSNRTTTFVNSGQLTFQLTIADQATASNTPLTVTNPAPGGGTSNAIQVAINNPIPGPITLNPNAEIAGGAPATVTVAGSNFVSRSVVQVNGSARPTTFVGATQVTFQPAAADLSAAGSLQVSVLNPTPGGGTSPTATLAIGNPIPSITSIAPNAVVTGSAASSVAVTGSNFVSSTLIQVNGSVRSTTYVSSTQLSVALTTADFATAGSLSLVAANPAPGGGNSAAATLTVANSVNPLPVLLGFSPYLVPVGRSTPTTITVSGTGFISTSTVQVGGAARPATYIGPSQLTFQLTAADQATVGNVSVTIVNPGPGGGTSTVGSITVYSGTPPPSIFAVAPDPLYAGEGNTTLTIQGSNFTSTSVVEWNGSPLQTAISGFSSLIGASVPASLLASAGTATVNVYNSTSNPGLSDSIAIPIEIPPVPTLTTLSSSAGPTNTTTILTISGGPFLPASTVSWNGTNIPSTYVGQGQIDVTIPAPNIAIPGNYNLSVTTPAPGGGTSNSLIYTAFVSLPNNDMVYNPVNGLFYVSVPGSAGAPLGNSIVSIDPATGALSAPLYIGSEPDRLAITSDGDYLWVGLDASGSVKQVDLRTNTVSAPFSVYGFSPFQSPAPVSALAALPGASNSVVVATDGAYPAIYDDGVIRGSNPATCIDCVNAIRIDSTKAEIYAAEGTTEEIYTWNSAGLTLERTNNSSSGDFSGIASGGSLNPNDEFQVISGTLYTDFGTAFNSETGTALGTFYNPSYSSGAYPANGPSYADSSLGKIFYLDTASDTGYLYQQIQAFNLSNYSLASSPAIPITVISTSVGSANAFPSRLSRWGSNGLAFRTASAVYSVRSNSVNDLSQTSADLQIGVSVSGGAVTGSNTTYTATVTNAGPSSATNVVVNYRTTSIISPTQVTVAIPASDLALPGTAVLAATNPGASASSTLPITIN
jgi:hypothetical protein